MSTVFAFTILLFQLSQVAWSNCDGRVRVVIDVGSGTTKMSVAQVKICQGQSPEVVSWIEQGISKPLALEAGKRDPKTLPIKMQKRLVQTLKELRAKALNFAQDHKLELEVAVVATHAIRTAKNAKDIQARVQKETGLELHILTQAEEARLGRLGVPADLCPIAKRTVWDIGGGSSQISDEQNTFGFPIGSEAFRKKIIAKWTLPQSGACVPDSTASPNPIGYERFPGVRSWAQLQAEKLMKEKGLHKVHPCVVGIGGIHNKAIYNNMKKLWPQLKNCVCRNVKGTCEFQENTYSRQALVCLARRFSTKSDCDSEIRGAYSATSVSSLFLVLGWMDALDINEVKVAEVHMGQALVIDEKFQFQKLSNH